MRWKKSRALRYIFFNFLIIIAYQALATLALLLLTGSFDLINNAEYIYGALLEMLVVLSLFNIIFTLYEKQKRSKYILFNTLPLSVVIYNFFGTINFVNKQVLRDFGYNRDDIIGHKLVNFVAEEGKEDFAEKLKEFVGNKNKKDVLVSTNSVVSSAGEKTELFIYTMFYDSFHLISIGVNKSEFNYLQDMYNEQVDFLWSLLESLPKPMMYIDVESFKIKYINKLAEDFVGLSKDKIIGLDSTTLFNAKNVEKNKKIIQRSVLQRKPVKLNEVLKINGKTKRLLFDAVPDMRQKNPNSTFIFIHDETPELIVKRKLELSNRLNKSLFEISEILANISPNDAQKSFNEALENISNTLNINKVYMIRLENKKIVIYNESNTGDYITPFIDKELKLNDKQFNYYKNLANQHQLKSYIDEYSPHKKLFNAQSCLDVYLKHKESCKIFGVAALNKKRKFTGVEQEYMISVSSIINETEEILEEYKKIEEQEETLNTLLDNTDLGIIISNLNNIVYYINDNAKNMFRIREGNRFVIEDYVFEKKEKKKVIDFIEKREQYKKHGCVIKTVDNIYYKLYSSQIDYESSKAYLTTVTDITGYIDHSDIISL